MRSLPFVAVCLSLSETTFARVPHSFRDLNQRDDEAESNAKVLDRVSGWLERLFRRDLVPARNLRPRQAETCVQDDYYSAAQDYPGICQSYMNYPTQTEYDDYTPIRYALFKIVKTMNRVMVDTCTARPQLHTPQKLSLLPTLLRESRRIARRHRQSLPAMQA